MDLLEQFYEIVRCALEVMTLDEFCRKTGVSIKTAEYYKMRQRKPTLTTAIDVLNGLGFDLEIRRGGYTNARH